MTRRDDGQALVEFALVLPLLLVILFGVIEFGRLVNYWQHQNSVASELARAAAVDRYPADVNGYLTSRAISRESRDGSSSVDRLQVSLCYPDGTDVGRRVRVTVASTFHLLPVLGVLNPNVPIKGSADMRVEVKPTGSVSTSCPA